jgi:hypothetical protein
MSDNYITAEELRAIAHTCDSLKPLWDALTTPNGDVSIESGELDINVFDSNGETLGRIAWCDSGAAFYPNS